jgi:hypothetical protein
MQALRFAWHSAVSLFHNIPDRVGVIYRPTYEINARTPEVMPLNVEGEMLSHIMTVVRDRGIMSPLRFRPYWNSSLRYSTAEVFGAIVQSVDLHDAELLATAFPPEADVAKFIDEIKNRPFKVRIGTQLEIALDITDNDLLGAVNLCWVATRFMGRGADQRVYPDIYMDENEVRKWNDELAQFETYNNHGKNDSPGDNYYFWSHVFGAMVFSNRGLGALLAQFAFGRGTEIMAFVRRYIARKQPNLTAHAPASALGRAIGLALANLDETNLG